MSTEVCHLASQNFLQRPGLSWFLLHLNQTLTHLSDHPVFLHRALTFSWGVEGRSVSYILIYIYI